MITNFYVSAEHLEETRKVVRSLDSLKIINDKPTRIGSEGKGYDVFQLSVEGNVKDMNTLYNKYLSMQQGKLAWRPNAN
jgi:hypothetical protein